MRATADMPGIPHHELEVDVVVDGCTDVGVVVLELLPRDLSVDLPANVERRQELRKHLLRGLSACVGIKF